MSTTRVRFSGYSGPPLELSTFPVTGGWAPLWYTCQSFPGKRPLTSPFVSSGKGSFFCPKTHSSTSRVESWFLLPNSLVFRKTCDFLRLGFWWLEALQGCESLVDSSTQTISTDKSNSFTKPNEKFYCTNQTKLNQATSTSTAKNPGPTDRVGRIDRLCCCGSAGEYRCHKVPLGCPTWFVAGHQAGFPHSNPISTDGTCFFVSKDLLNFILNGLNHFWLLDFTSALVGFTTQHTTQAFQVIQEVRLVGMRRPPTSKVSPPP